MIVLETIGERCMGIFGEAATDARGDAFWISPHVGTLYEWRFEFLLRRDLDCKTPPPPDSDILKELSQDLDQLEKRAPEIRRDSNKLYVIRELFILRTCLDELPDSKLAKGMEKRFLDSLKRGLVGKFFEGETIVSLRGILDGMLEDDPINAYGLTRSFLMWSGREKSFLTLLLGDVGDTRDLAAQTLERILTDLETRDDTRSLLLLHRFLNAERKRSLPLFRRVVGKLRKRFEAHATTLERQHAYKHLLTLFNREVLVRRAKDALRPQIAGETIEVILPHVRPYRELLDDHYAALVRFDERQKRDLKSVRDALDAVDPMRARELLDGVSTEAHELEVRPTSEIDDLFDETERMAGAIYPVEAMRDEIAQMIADGNYRAAWDRISEFRIASTVIDNNTVREELRARVRTSCSTAVSKRMADTEARLAKLAGAGNSTDAIRAAEAFSFGNLLAGMRDIEGLEESLDTDTARQRLKDVVLDVRKHLVERAVDMVESRRLIDLLFLCETHPDIEDLQEFADRFGFGEEHFGSTRIRHEGRAAIWIRRRSIVVHSRSMASDVPFTNFLVSSVPIAFEVGSGTVSLRVNTTSDHEIKNPIELSEGDERMPVIANRDYELGNRGTIFFSRFFTMRYWIKRKRFLQIEFDRPDEDAFVEAIGQQLDLGLSDVWPTHAEETARAYFVGV